MQYEPIHDARELVGGGHIKILQPGRKGKKLHVQVRT